MNNFGSSAVIWITGLSGAGKTTLAAEVVNILRSDGKAVIMLDGDELRDVFGDEARHDRESRLRLALRYSRLCQMLGRQGINVVIATISLFSDVHIWNRTNIPGYFEVYLRVPLEELRRRDPKGIYRRFDSGETTNVAGLDMPIDEPPSPDIIIDFDQAASIRESACSIVAASQTI
ncbi:MAG: adenylyl-sulfate kinase [Bradyrhizobium sp.]|nr:adenylyl-sulfate kinase [Bradyrhizobium sp.]